MPNRVHSFMYEVHDTRRFMSVGGLCCFLIEFEFLFLENRKRYTYHELLCSSTLQ